MSMQVINEDHFVPEVVYGAGTYTLNKDKVGTRFVLVAIRTLVNPMDSKDVEQVHSLQDKMVISQSSTGRFEVPDWTRLARRKCVMHYWFLRPRSPTSKRPSAQELTLIRCDT